MAKAPPPGGHGLAIIIGSPHDAGKASREDAGFVGAEQHCVDCSMYDVQTGDCAKVEGTGFDPQDGCSRYFQPSSEDESSEEGGMPPGDDAEGADSQ